MLPLAGVANDSLLIRGGGTPAPAPEAAIWHLVGDPLANADLVRWAPRFKLEEQPLAEYNGFQRVLKAEISVDAKDSSKLALSDWPSAQPVDSAIAVVWLLKGKPVKTEVRPLESMANGRWTGKFSLLLSPLEAEGQPVLMLWTKGEFLTPKPEYSDKPTQQAFVSAVTDDVTGLKNALTAGARLKRRSRSGATLVHFAAMANAPGALAFLLQQNPSLAHAASEFDGDTPLRWAALTGRVTAVQLLLQAGAPTKPGYEDDQVNSVRISSHVTFAQTISGPMASAVLVGHTDVVRLLLKAGAPTHADDGSEPVESAVSSGYADLVAVLMHAGGVPDFKQQGNSLAYQAREGREPIVHLLLEHGVDPNSCVYVNSPADVGVTALMGTAQSNSVQTAATLLAHGADPNRETPDGVTALQVAAEANSPDVVRLLLAHYADATTRNKAGLTPLDVALRNDAREAATALAQGGARVDLRAANAQELLEDALREDVSVVISSALADGWNVNAKMRDVCSALVLARYFGAKACERILHAAGASEPDQPSIPWVRLNELDAALKPIHATMPGNLRLVRESETVRVEFVLNGEGRTLFAHALDSPARSLTVATLRALQNWAFNKPTVAGKPVQVRVEMPIVYKKGKNSSDFDLDSNMPEVLRRATPTYPAALLPRRTFGRVTLDFLVMKDGSISDVKVASSSDPGFEGRALEALRNFRFGPRTMRGEPVEDRMLLALDFPPPR